MSKPKSRVALSLITAITALSFAGGAYAQTTAPEPAPETAKPAGDVPPPTLDTNEDGKPDAWDTNGDGKPDVLDNDGDGKPDKDAKAKPAPKPEI
jgi:hypothetical protein